MKRTISISLFYTLIFLALLISLLIAGCGRSQEEIKKDASNIVNNYKEEVEKYEGWVQNKADFDNPVIENQNTGFISKIDTLLSKWNQNKDMFKNKLKIEDYNKFESEITTAGAKVSGIEDLFKKKLISVQGDIQSSPEHQTSDEENN
jgi:cytochrome c556